MATAEQIKAAAKAKGTKAAAAEAVVAEEKKAVKRAKPHEVLGNLKARREKAVARHAAELQKLDELIADKEAFTVSTDEAAKTIVSSGGADALRAQIRKMSVALRIAGGLSPEELAALAESGAEDEASDEDVDETEA